MIDPIPNLYLRQSAFSASAEKKVFALESFAEMIEGCLKEDRMQQRKLYEEFYNLVFSICLRYTNERREAKSFANLCFLKIFKNLNQYKEQGTFVAWLSKVSIHVCLDQVRSRINYQKKHVEAEGRVDKAINATVIDHLDLEDLYKVIQELPGTHQTVFNLHVVDGYKHGEIAEMLGISTGTSRWYLAKAKELLQQKLKRYEK